MHIHLKEILVLAAGVVVGQWLYTKVATPATSTPAA